MFPVYLELGFDHILDLNGYDHILFIIALCAIFSVRDWKKILILVTAFTVGHTITLALSSLSIINVPANLIEFLIPVTIFLTALQNLWHRQEKKNGWSLNYFLALFFGLIHGMGFSNYFKSLLGREADIVLPLFAFNIGVELGQLCIVACIMVLNLIVTGFFRVKQQYWNIPVSLGAAALALFMIFQKL
jgi:hydrogenase/urease accessory protein HupE